MSSVFDIGDTFYEINNGYKFNLQKLNIENLKNLLEADQAEKVTVVSIIGKSSLHQQGIKTTLLEDAIGRIIFQPNLGEEKPFDANLNYGIEGFFDPESQVIYLHLSGVFDTAHCIQVCRQFEKELKEKSFLEVWSHMQTNLVTSLLLLFTVSHIILIVHPTAVFDLNYIYLFRILDDLRIKFTPKLSELLQEFPLPQDWVTYGRPCSPRILFVFLDCPRTPPPPTKKDSTSPVKKLAHDLEDQIYRILRRSRVITNICSNSLFAVPPNQEFVYLLVPGSKAKHRAISEDPTGFLMNLIEESCLWATSDTESRNRGVQSLSAQLDAISFSGKPAVEEEPSFHRFLFQHINLALSRGFEDNVGRIPAPSYFEVPMAQDWFKLVVKLHNWMFDPDNDELSSAVHSALDIDVGFSEQRCGKVLPMAILAYQEGLPPQYTEEYHERKLLHAISVFRAQARGPVCPKFLEQLKSECQRIWQENHQMCEVLSLTGNPCVNPIHQTPEEDEDGVPHTSQVTFVSGCDCGRKQASRKDPFDIKAANFDFYQSLHDDCCSELERIEFPTSAGMAVSPPRPVRTARVPPRPSNHRRRSESSRQSESGESLDQLTPSEEEEEEEYEEVTEEEATEDEDLHLSEHNNREESSSLPECNSQEDEDEGREAVSRSTTTTTTEYAPAMLTLGSPTDCLPTFPSWSLVCLGPSSLYSHNIGIQDQPGFFSGSNFLLPWDVTVEQRDKWLWRSVKGKKSGVRDSNQFTVKIFLGVEYECPRGHRFMCSAADRVLRSTSSGLVKDNANRIASGDMPLYFPCLCSRSTKDVVAQLTRLHVVTPKAPVHVTLFPRVQPPSSSEVFCPAHEPVRLSQSAYWVLRLPFIYEGREDGMAHMPPKELTGPDCGKLLKGTYDIAEQTCTR